MPLHHVGNKKSVLKDVLKEEFEFVASCYGVKEIDFSKIRQSLWVKKTDELSRNSKPPSLKILPPTKEALELNIKRAHYTAILWNDSITGIMFNLDPCDYGWEKRYQWFSTTSYATKGCACSTRRSTNNDQV